MVDDDSFTISAYIGGVSDPVGASSFKVSAVGITSRNREWLDPYQSIARIRAHAWGRMVGADETRDVRDYQLDGIENSGTLIPGSWLRRIEGPLHRETSSKGDKAREVRAPTR
jgi:hypothetical protein